MHLSSEEKEVGKENFYAAIGSKQVRRSFLQKSINEGAASKNGLGTYYFGYDKSLAEPLRVGVIGMGAVIL